MRRLLLTAVAAVAVAAPAVAFAQTGTDIAASDLVDRHFERIELRKEARKQMRAARAKKRQARERRAVAAVAVPPHLEAIAQCESGGDPTAVSSNGMYHGKYQFSVATWQAVGGSGLPSAAPESEQDMRAAMLYAQSGPGQWPVCG